MSQETKAEVFEKHANVLQIEERLGKVEEFQREATQKDSLLFSDAQKLEERFAERLAVQELDLQELRRKMAEL